MAATAVADPSSHSHDDDDDVELPPHSTVAVQLYARIGMRCGEEAPAHWQVLRALRQAPAHWRLRVCCLRGRDACLLFEVHQRGERGPPRPSEPMALRAWERLRAVAQQHRVEMLRVEARGVVRDMTRQLAGDPDPEGLTLWVGAREPFAAAAMRNNKRKRVASTTTTTEWQRLPARAWGRVLAHIGTPRGLIPVSMVNRALKRLIWDNHALMRVLYERHWGWSRQAPLNVTHKELSPPSLKTLGVRSSSQWDARRTWHMPPAIRAAFNAHVHRLCAVQFAPWCSLCHRDAPERSAAHYGIWTLRLRVCRGCLRAHLISNRELFETYGVRPSTWIAFEDGCTTDDQELIARHHVGQELLRGCFYFLHRGPQRGRTHFSHSAADFERVLPLKETLVVFFWRPHVERVLRLGKARAYLLERQAAVRALIPYVLRSAVRQRILLGPPYYHNPGFVGLTAAHADARLERLFQLKLDRIAAMRTHATLQAEWYERLLFVERRPPPSSAARGRAAAVVNLLDREDNNDDALSFADDDDERMMDDDYYSSEHFGANRLRATISQFEAEANRTAHIMVPPADEPPP